MTSEWIVLMQKLPWMLIIEVKLELEWTDLPIDEAKTPWLLN